MTACQSPLGSSSSSFLSSSTPAPKPTSEPAECDGGSELKVLRVMKRAMQKIKPGEVVAYLISSLDPQPRPVVADLRVEAPLMDPQWLCDALMAKVQEVVAPGQPLLSLKLCQHPVQIDGGLCAECGAKVTRAMIEANTKAQAQATPVRQRSASLPRQVSNADVALFTLLEGGGSRLIFTPEGVANEAQRLTKMRLERERLCLVLDLDQTLIETTADERAQVALFHQKKKLPIANNVHVLEVSDQSPGGSFVMRYYVKLRPGLRKFLEDCREIFDLYVYTNGHRNYADQLKELIDPTGKLFDSRILTFSETKESFKALEKLMPWTHHSHVMVVDDRAIDIWGTCKNLVKIPAFHYWRAHDHSIKTFPTGQYFPSRSLKKPPPIPQVDTPDDFHCPCACPCSQCRNHNANNVEKSSVSSVSSVSSSSSASSSSSSSSHVVNFTSLFNVSTIADHILSHLDPAEVILLSTLSRFLWHRLRAAWERICKLFRYERSPSMSRHVMPTAWQPFQTFAANLLRGWSSPARSKATPGQASPAKGDPRPAPAGLLGSSCLGSCSCVDCCGQRTSAKDQCWFLYFIYLTKCRAFPHKSPYSYACPVERIVQTGSLQDRGLHAVYQLLKKVHNAFFENSRKRISRADAPEADTRFILRAERAKVLANTALVFGGIFPQGTDVHKSLLGQLAQFFGAEILAELKEGVTHVVCLTNKTQKAAASAGLKNPPFVVSAHWLLDSLQLYQRRDEVNYAAPDSGLAPDEFHKRYTHLIHELHKNCVEGWELECDTSEAKGDSPNKRQRTSSTPESGSNSDIGSDSEPDADLEASLLKSFVRGSPQSVSSDSGSSDSSSENTDEVDDDDDGDGEGDKPQWNDSDEEDEASQVSEDGGSFELEEYSSSD